LPKTFLNFEFIHRDIINLNWYSCNLEACQYPFNPLSIHNLNRLIIDARYFQLTVSYAFSKSIFVIIHSFNMFCFIYNFICNHHMVHILLTYKKANWLTSITLSSTFFKLLAKIFYITLYTQSTRDIDPYSSSLYGLSTLGIR